MDSASGAGRLPKLEGIDYKRAAIDYPGKLDAERLHYLRTKPFYNLANKPPKFRGEGMDVETHRHFCDFANMAAALGLRARVLAFSTSPVAPAGSANISRASVTTSRASTSVRS